jgi:UDP-glucose 4-epimerase
VGYSVKEVIAAYEKACGRKLPQQIDPKRAGDLASVYANGNRAKELLGFTCRYDLETMCADSWRWQQSAVKQFHNRIYRGTYFGNLLESLNHIFC